MQVSYVLFPGSLYAMGIILFYIQLEELQYLE